MKRDFLLLSFLVFTPHFMYSAEQAPQTPTMKVKIHVILAHTNSSLYIQTKPVIVAVDPAETLTPVLQKLHEKIDQKTGQHSGSFEFYQATRLIKDEDAVTYTKVPVQSLLGYNIAEHKEQAGINLKKWRHGIKLAVREKPQLG